MYGIALLFSLIAAFVLFAVFQPKLLIPLADKGKDWVIIMDGLEMLEVQEFQFPEIEIEAIAHSEGDYDSFTPGRTKTSDFELKKISRGLVPDNWVWAKLLEAGAYGTPLTPFFMKSVILQRKDFTESYLLTGTWCTKVSWDNFNKASSDNVMKTLTFKVARVFKTV